MAARREAGLLGVLRPKRGEAVAATQAKHDFVLHPVVARFQGVAATALRALGGQRPKLDGVGARVFGHWARAVKETASALSRRSCENPSEILANEHRLAALAFVFQRLQRDEVFEK